MGIIKVQCSCGMLWLSETLGGYDTICDHDGKICGAVNYQDDNRLLVLFWFNPNRTQIFIQSSRGDIEN